MKAIIIVAVAVLIAVGLGYEFANSRFGGGQAAGASGDKSVAAQGDASAQSSAKGVDAVANGLSSERGQDFAKMHPENDGAQFHSGHFRTAQQAANAMNAHAASISFEGAELPQAELLRRRHAAQGHGQNAEEWKDPAFAADDAREKTETYVRHAPVRPRAARAGRPSTNNDDLLIMEGRSEERLSASNATSSAQH